MTMYKVLHVRNDIDKKKKKEEKDSSALKIKSNLIFRDLRTAQSRAKSYNRTDRRTNAGSKNFRMGRKTFEMINKSNDIK